MSSESIDMTTDLFLSPTKEKLRKLSSTVASKMYSDSSELNNDINYKFVEDLNLMLQTQDCWFELSSTNVKVELQVLQNFNMYTQRFKNKSTSNQNCDTPITSRDGSRVLQKPLDDFLNLLVKYKFLVLKHGAYLLLNTSKPFVWHNVMNMTTSDVIQFFKGNKSTASTYLGVFSDRTVLLKELIQSDDYINTKYFPLYHEFILLVKCLFWYFRKTCVDALISKCSTKTSDQATLGRRPLTEQNLQSKNTLEAISVGSTRLESDYDITLYGNYKYISRAIECFNKSVRAIFGVHENSESLFDTNVYGLSFIKQAGMNVYSPSENGIIYSQSVQCGTQTFQTTMNNTLSKDTQHVFSLIKLLKTVKTIQVHSEKLSELITTHLEQELPGNVYLSTAMSFLHFLANYNKDYVTLLENFSTFFKKYMDHDKLQVFNTYISMVNYYGSETYYTRGAFLDVVVNQQTCKDTVLNLDEDAYIDSFIENVADLMKSFHKEKYLKRAIYALEKLPKVYPTQNAIKTLESIRKIQKGCSADILNCSYFLLVYKCVTCVTEIFGYYTKNNQTSALDILLLKDIQTRERQT
ncbi:hypothetical protein EB118_13375 [bacterium]|nr:hypothetical protein [bacterium]NDD83756.1 hypothetical protein [bacterium]NDG31043.1 hypothetical protein [bacterium]